MLHEHSGFVHDWFPADSPQIVKLPRMLRSCPVFFIFNKRGVLAF